MTAAEPRGVTAVIEVRYQSVTDEAAQSERDTP
jgi:hypothetical protein